MPADDLTSQGARPSFSYSADCKLGVFCFLWLLVVSYHLYLQLDDAMFQYLKKLNLWYGLSKSAKDEIEWLCNAVPISLSIKAGH